MERDFKGVWIPKEIWLSEDLGWTEKFLLTEIDSLEKNRECFATNDYFAKFFKLSKDRVSKIISSLAAKGYVEVNLIYKEGTKQVEKRIITTTGYKRKQLEGIGENDDTPIGENNEDINTSFNNTKEYIYTIFKYWNSKKIIVHKKLNGAMESHINARLEDHTIDELKKAIDNFNEILTNDDYFWTCRWTLQDFMKPNNVIKFLPSSKPFETYLSNKKKKYVSTIPSNEESHTDRNVESQISGGLFDEEWE